MADLQVELLGRFRVTVGALVVPESAWRRRKAAALLKLLALAPGHRLLREQVTDLLWPELDPRAAGANLRKALHHARRALDHEDGALLIASDGGLLRLPPEQVTVDVDAFFAAVARARRTREPDDYVRAVDLYSGGLLPDDRYEEWAGERRDELHVEFLAALEELAAVLEARGDLAGATRALRRIVAEEPFREAAHAWLIRLQALAGRRHEALDTYARLRKLFAAELSVEPGPDTQRLYEEIRANQAPEPELGVDLWERVGDLRVLAGDTKGAVKAFHLALELAEPDEGSARLHRKVASAWLMHHDPARAAPQLRAAERLGSDAAEHARVVRLWANEAWERGDLDAAKRLAEEARKLAEAHGDSDDVAAAHEALAVVSHLRGDWRRGLELEIQRLDAAGTEDTQLQRVFDVHHCIGQYHLYGDALTENVERYARQTLALAEEAEAVRAQAFAWCLLGEVSLLRARWDEAAGCLERSCELHESLGTPTAALPWQRLAELAVCRGELADVDAPLRRAAAIATVSPMAQHLWGRIHATAAFAALERHDPEAAARSVRERARAAVRYGDCPTCSALVNPIAAEAFAALGDREGARAHAAEAARVAEFFDSSAWRAMAASAVGSAAAAEGDLVRAQESFRSAARLYERAQQPYWAARSLAQAEASA